MVAVRVVGDSDARRWTVVLGDFIALSGTYCSFERKWHRDFNKYGDCWETNFIDRFIYCPGHPDSLHCRRLLLSPLGILQLHASLGKLKR